jgi:uncharacterized protein (TIGR03435 family)
MLKSRLFGAVGIVAIVVRVLMAQAPANPAFDVVSVKVDKSGARGARGGFEAGGRYTLTNITTQGLLLGAFSISESQIVDAPGWTREDRFDIVAKMPEGSFDAKTGPAGPPNTARMLRTLLEERFKLKAHEDMRELLEGALVMARADGKFGPKLTPATAEDTTCAPSAAVSSAMDPFKGVGPCGFLSGPSSNPGKRRMLFRGGTLDQLALSLRGLDMLATVPNVLNETGLSGAFNIDLEYEPVRPSGVPDATAEGPLLSTALVEQLGLKIVTRKRPTSVIVIDHIERPTED